MTSAITEALQKALTHHRDGQLDEAEKIYRAVLKEQPQNPEANYNLGILAMQIEQPKVALPFLQTALKSNPGNGHHWLSLVECRIRLHAWDKAEALLNEAESKGLKHPAVARLRQKIGDGRGGKPSRVNAQDALQRGIQFHQSGQLGEAAGWYQKTLEIQPENTDALNNLGGVLQAQGKLDEAVACYNKAISIKPDSAEAHYNLGNTLKDQGKLDKAVAGYQKAVSIDPDFADAHHNLGYALQELGRLEEAVASYQEAVSVKPDLAEAYNNIGLLYEKTNDLVKAEKYIAKARSISPGAANIKYAQSVILRRKGQIDDAIQLLESVDVKKISDQVAAKNINFELGRLYDRKENSSKAFYHISSGNKLHSKNYQSTIAAKDEFLSGISITERVLTRDWVRSWPNIPQGQATRNAFIVGFPRSGTTLLDQILDSHARIQVMEEKEAIGDVIQSITGDYPQSLASLGESDVQKLRKLYFKAVNSYITWDSNTILVDKFPLNIRHIPLIARLFPNTRIILAMRHPYDVVLSNFMQNYRINNAMANFFTIEDSALAYKQVMGLWQKSVSLLPVNYHTVKYESLVAGFNVEVGQLLKFLEVDWDDAVLEYDNHAKKRGHIKTPSYQSVTEPIYQRAKYRWKRYEEQLEPVMKGLEPFIEAFGY